MTSSESTTLPPASFVLPDLHALTSFPASFNPHYAAAAAESSAWIASFPGALTDATVKRAIFLWCASSLLCAHAYPYADHESLRTTCDFFGLLFTIDEISDDQDEGGARKTGSALYEVMKDPDYDDGSTLCRMAKDLTTRLHAHCGPLTYARMLKYCKAYTEAVAREADLRARGVILDLDSYVAIRRENSAVRFCLELAGGALNVDLPDEVVEDPTFVKMHLAAVDMIYLANDLYSYNMEQAKGHTTNNVMTVLMHHLGLDLQGAANYIAEHFKTLMETYLEAKRTLPTWDAVIDLGVARHAMAMECWIVGNLNWSFESQRYFGAAGAEVRKSRVVRLYPRDSHLQGGSDGDD
ncbi:terpenoid synthase [Lentinus tigrinus ALCF2SS1-7]|uniref:terpenoid synthase n=1 Tax=Lentinus tigrinus ALCF2SS1-7 TaxID=1328758 RepID=UPI001165DD58|nr:terpenoid synthase [Lentinus tigrinus ALCF2SS1-7]